MDSLCIKQTVCKVLKIFQCGKYLVAYVLKQKQKNTHVTYNEIDHHRFIVPLWNTSKNVAKDVTARSHSFWMGDN